MIYNKKNNKMEFRHKEILYEWGVLDRIGNFLKLTPPIGTKYVTNPKKLEELFNDQY